MVANNLKPSDSINLLKPRQVSKMLNISLPMVYKLAEKGRLANVRLPSCGDGDKAMVRFRLEDIRAFIDEHYRPSDRIESANP